MAGGIDELIGLLDLEELEVNIFRGYSPKEDRERVFGGQVAAQALVAAPIVYFVDRIRDGKTFTTRRVVAIQHGEAIFNISVSFQRTEPGFEHQLPMPAAPDPESLPTFNERMERMWGRAAARRMIHERPIDIRWCEPEGWKPHAGADSRGMVWMRAEGTLPDDPKLHTAVLVYASDYTLTESVMRPHGVHWVQPGVMSASLDHCVWLHHRLRADQWWLYVHDSPAATGARGLARGTIFTQSGKLVCSVMQEVLLRTRGS